MSNEIVGTSTEKSAIVAMDFSEQQVDLIKKTVARGTTNDELALFLYTCKRTGLDPLLRQIYAVVRKDKNYGSAMAIQTGIDGYRLIAERTGKYSPGREPSFVETGDGIISATAYVNKLVGGSWHEVAATAFFEEYNAKNVMWTKMPHTMIAKCAEALALRRAFPAEMGGIYTNEEMQQADANVVKAEILEPTKVKKTTTAKTTKSKVADVDTKIIKGVISFFAEKEGNKPYRVELDTGDKASTYTDELGVQLEELQGVEVEIECTVQVNGRYTNYYVSKITEVATADNKAEEDTPSEDYDGEGLD